MTKSFPQNRPLIPPSVRTGVPSPQGEGGERFYLIVYLPPEGKAGEIVKNAPRPEWDAGRIVHDPWFHLHLADATLLRLNAA